MGFMMSLPKFTLIITSLRNGSLSWAMGKEMILRLFLEPDGLPRGFLGGGDREGDPLGTDLLHHVVVVDGVSIAKILGEAFGAFELRRRPARPESLDAGGGEIVHDAGAERRLGSDHHQVDFLRSAERDHRAMVGGIERHHLAFARDTGIARRADEPSHERARRHFPGQRMLTPARAKKENVHGCATGPQARLAAGGVA